MMTFDGKIEAIKTEDELSTKGFILTFGSVEETVKKAVGTLLEVALGFNATAADADKQVGVVKPRNGIVEEFVLDQSRTTDIVYGDKLVVSSGDTGSVIHETDNVNGTRVGYAREAVTAGETKAKILMEVRFE